MIATSSRTPVAGMNAASKATVLQLRSIFALSIAELRHPPLLEGAIEEIEI
jgi:hypothetical protein